MLEHSLQQAIKVYANADEASAYVADKIAQIIKAKQEKGNLAILGLATGSTPKGVYRELVRLHQSEGLSFQNVVTFNLDEYYPMHPVEEQSYVAFMKQNLFNHIDIPAHQIHIPDGTLELSAIQAYCDLYEQKIVDFGGLDMQLLGIGRSGHIGFNEPGSLQESLTRLVQLDAITREDAADDFGGADKVPTQAITMGIQTIVQAKQIFLLALSERKAAIIQKALKGEISTAVPATFLQQLEHVEYILDQKAAALL
ncbi:MULTISPECIES: glucosamine-6-phosphate deaminase [Myroides]|uniref:Glucosamine-6-phosphate deaminase n=1 Tax=Myroides odoratus TaxID=256 RepID=A0A9Q6ZAA8_MYROD|nr:glucosamine-6-phosphate deaminase [Myroides odoratus]EHQ41175.1 glucosamine/galactosamine-6-phosphate isomerase [Myroides odoratus DSM 2801]EKB08452.1 glucosamine-6-phosphate deaminase [Myroides odoratus CIP 103059]QQT98625.1 glucosamine-6-phosphate deaminase [Myroides odoratus]WQD59201.1 glucosamine-6-phosphate deaminase [Myroides odoratus]STZ32212.1 Glucosamine-6-phosphate deaminase 1 [Myroides odoratus]